MPRPVIALNVPQAVRKVNETRKITTLIDGPLQIGLMVEIFHHRSIGGPIDGGRVDASRSAICRRHGVAGLNNVAGVVIILRVSHRSNHGVLVGECRQFRQMLAHQQPGRTCRDRLIRPANLLRSLGFHVEGIELSGTTEQIQKDDRLGPSLGDRARFFGGQKASQTRPQQTCTAGTQHLAAMNPITQALRMTLDREHDIKLRGLTGATVRVQL